MPFSVYKSFSSQIKEADQQKAAGATTQGGKSTVGISSSGGRDYSWGSRFDQKSTRGMQSKIITKGGKRVGTYTQKSGKYAGMIAMQASTQNAKSSNYMTFRIVSAGSDPMSWIVPEQPPWPVRQSVVDYMRPFAEEMLQQALEQDIK
jgi:hypothetical protein